MNERQYHRDSAKRLRLCVNDLQSVLKRLQKTEARDLASTTEALLLETMERARATELRALNTDPLATRV